MGKFSQHTLFCSVWNYLNLRELLNIPSTAVLSMLHYVQLVSSWSRFSVTLRLVANIAAMIIYQQYILFVLFVSLLSHFWLIHLFYLHLFYQPYVGLCQATRVQSHQRQSTSAVAIATREVQVSAADYQTVPTVATGVAKPLCCRLALTFTLTSENLSLYITLLL